MKVSSVGTINKTFHFLVCRWNQEFSMWLTMKLDWDYLIDCINTQCFLLAYQLFLFSVRCFYLTHVSFGDCSFGNLVGVYKSLIPIWWAWKKITTCFCVLFLTVSAILTTFSLCLPLNNTNCYSLLKISEIAAAFLWFFYPPPLLLKFPLVAPAAYRWEILSTRISLAQWISSD